VINLLVHLSSTGKSSTLKKLFSVPAGTYCSLTHVTAGHTAYRAYLLIITLFVNSIIDPVNLYSYREWLID